jgi:hypothetical protein
MLAVAHSSSQAMVNAWADDATASRRPVPLAAVPEREGAPGRRGAKALPPTESQVNTAP